MRALFAVSVVLFGLRLWAANRVGFGDSEALYASWALHPQPAYLDHPGLVGLAARAIGEGAAPTPARTHVVTAIVATLVPWLVVAVARAAGAEKRRAAAAGLVVALVPEIAVGLFALTPDLLLAPLWLGAIGLAVVGLLPRDDRGGDDAGTAPGAPSIGAAGALLGAGLLAGVAASAKVSGLLLVAALATAYVQIARSSGAGRAAARSIWPWAGLAAGLVVVFPFALYEARLGWPMLRHRFVDTQENAGLALQNLGALAGGQLVYLSPVVAWLALVVARDLVRRRNDDVASRVLFFTFAVPLVPLTVLCLWSRGAEPHWLAPPLLALPIHAARRATSALLSRRLVSIGAGVAGLFTLLAHGWVLVPAAGKLVPADVDPKTDIASELYGWPDALAAVRDQMALAATPFDPEGREVVVVGPHWTVCAQVHAALAGVRVGCATPISDDFDRWLPRETWRRADNVLFVTDNRFPGDGADQLPALVRVSQSRVRVLRGGRTARTFDLYLYSRRHGAALGPDLLPVASPESTAGAAYVGDALSAPSTLLATAPVHDAHPAHVSGLGRAARPRRVRERRRGKEGRRGFEERSAGERGRGSAHRR
ncbi:MAG: hypothetical protein KF764_03505 [Labilithrix sp.]|nr:hypothetical protein [Labilithrix sp.]